MRINLFGGSGLGKSTTSSQIYAELKKKHINIELVREYIKEWAYLKRVPQSYDQCFIYANQLYQEDVLFQCGVKHIITDSPLLLQNFYSKKYKFPAYNDLLNISIKYEGKHPSINIFLDRNDMPFNEHGRFETLEQAKQIDNELLDFLNIIEVPFVRFDAMDTSVIVDFLVEKLKEG